MIDRFVILCCFRMGQKEMEGRKDSFLAGKVMVFIMVIGYTSGSYLSVALDKIGAFD